MPTVSQESGVGVMSATTDGAATNGKPTSAGRSRRKEDPRLITGRATYVDDINLTGQLWAAWVRSPEAHAKIVSIDTSAAQGARRRLARSTPNEDLDMEAGLPMAWVPPGVDVNTPDHWVLAKGEVKHVGDPVALVVGDDRYAVVDAAEDVDRRLRPAAGRRPIPRRRSRPARRSSTSSSAPTRCCDWSLGGGDLEAGFAEADVDHRAADRQPPHRRRARSSRAGCSPSTAATS